MKLNYNMIRWKLMKKIVECIQYIDGIIFGGYVRDKIIHDHFATEFYSNILAIRSKYNDKSYYKETSLRTILPVDIDCYINTSNFNELIKQLKDIQLRVIDEGENEARIYFADAPISVKHNKLKVNFAINSALNGIIDKKMCVVSVDVIHGDNSIVMDLPFGTLDFECNGIYLTSDNTYKLSNLLGKYLNPMEKIVKLNDIIKNIINKQTIIIYPNVNQYRIVNMINKGWTIRSKNVKIFKCESSIATKTTALEQNEICMICLDDFKTNKIQAKYMCCQGRMHTKCLKLVIENYDTCPMCREFKIIDEDDKKISSID